MTAAAPLPQFTRDPERIIMVYDHALARHVERRVGEYLVERGRMATLGQYMAQWGSAMAGVSPND